jgi:fructose-1-phosphate kinase PfkB-like protein
MGGAKTRFIVDCDGEALRFCMDNKKKPYMIKPNQFELEQYCGKKFELYNNFDSEISEVKKEAKKIYENTGTAVLCTLGKYGGLYCGNCGIFYTPAPKVEVKGFTGAGDAFLTAFIYFNAKGKSAEDSLTFAVAASAAKVTKPGTEFASFGEITEMYNKIK